MYEYKFYRLEGKVFKSVDDDYKKIIVDAGKDNWELVQIFAPSSVWMSGAPAFYDMILKDKNRNS